MAAKRKKPSERPPSSTATGRMMILLEQIQEQNRATIEAVTTLGTQLRAEMAELRRELLARIEALEAAVRQNSADIRKNSEDIRKNSEDIRKNSADIELLKRQMSELTDVVRGKPDATALLALEARVSRIEQRLGL